MASVTFLQDFFYILRRAGPWIFAALAVSTLFDQILNERLEILLQNASGPGAELWWLASLSLLNGLVFPIFALACALSALAQRRGGLPSFAALRTRLNQLYIESLRTWGSSLRWGLLLLLPGFVRFYQLTYVPFIVFFSRPYDDGNQDALKTSTRYVNRHPLRLAAFLTIFHVLLPLIAADFLDPWKTYWKTPLAAVGCTLFDVSLLIFSTLILFRFFDQTRQELKDESVLPVA